MKPVFDTNSLQGMRYLVTGGSSGLGRASVELLAACGASVTIAGRDPERLNQVLAGLPGSGHRISQLNLQNADTVAEWFKALAEETGPFDGVFHAAGIELIRFIRMTKQAHLDDVLSSSLFAAFGLARAASQKGGMVDGGSLLFMSSVAGSSGQAGMAAYSAAKAGIDGMVRSLASEMAPRRIRVNSLAAGAVQTPMHDRLTRGSTPEAAHAYESSHPLGFGEPGDIANAAVFLLGPASRWITGTTMVVDGGYLSK